MQADGEIRRWSASDRELFEDEEPVCAVCGDDLQVGQVVQERPAFSLKFFHVDADDCVGA